MHEFSCPRSSLLLGHFRNSKKSAVFSTLPLAKCAGVQHIKTPISYLIRSDKPRLVMEKVGLGGGPGVRDKEDTQVLRSIGGLRDDCEGSRQTLNAYRTHLAQCFIYLGRCAILGSGEIGSADVALARAPKPVSKAW